MTKLAILSDIHSNFEALQSVLVDIDAQGPDEIYCLGDVVGYGPQPQECCDLLRTREMVILQGNHEQGLINIHNLTRFNQPARDALRRTREMISEETYQWLVSHPKSATAHDCRFVHGTPPDSVNEYIWNYEESMDEVFSRYQEGVCFVGHTHDLMRFTSKDGQASAKLALPEGETLLDPGLRHLLNVGAVGQPRDGDPRAKYALFDTDSRILTLRFVSYDIEKTVRLIRSHGLHRAFADRLW
ncbi:metallophosphoesterase [Pseudodesulfovibrio cashew]|uniref:Metallophosphoesterase n=1 Tax=Pseudodesulfovibrio cashew TaxID=2678688 RepID=A0A6I6J9T0_9BACT|nr:metallophosphoesterase family protein [Pseudodesulfovibrio cashew]QGY39415.1 metallophosphoesterase [Pseudodesulfovibrio cashew]